MDEDDVPGLFFVEGSLFAASKRVHSSPAQLRADFENDGDWLRIDSRNPLLDYHVQVFLPEDGLEPTFGEYQWSIFDEDMNELDSGSQDFRVTFSVRNFSEASFLRITADAKSEVDASTGELIDVPTYYRVAVGQQGDAVGNTTVTAQPYENNYNGIVGGSLLDGDDVDFYSVDLTTGVEYEFVLFGDSEIDNELSDLQQPVFEIHDDNGLVADSTALGTGQQLIRFTPTQERTYYLKVASNEDFPVSGGFISGSYVIRSRQFDDDQLAPSTATRGVVTPGITFTNQVDFEGDVDWARIDGQRFFTYRVETPLNEDIGLRTRFGKEPSDGSFEPESQILYDQGGVVYVEFSGDTNADFLIEVLDEDENSDLSKASLTSRIIEGAIETAGDIDLFKSTLASFVDYTFTVRESTDQVWSGNLVVEALDTSGATLQTFNVTSENNTFNFNADDGSPARFTQNGLSREQLFRVSANNDEVTGYQLAFTPRGTDSVPSRLSTANLLPMPGGTARARNVIEGIDDWDIYRVELKPDKWYELIGNIDPSGDVQLYRATEDGSEEITPRYVNNRQYYRFEEAGTYYVAAGRTSVSLTSGFSGFDFSFKEDAVPVATARPFFSNDERLFSEVYNGRNLPTEVWSDVALQIRASDGGFQNIPAGNLTRITRDQWTQLRLVPGVTGPGEVIYRNIAGNGQRMPWEKYELVDNQPIPEFANVDVFSAFQTYWFAETLPSYLANDARFNTSFQPLDASQQDLVTTAINRWRDVFSTLPPANGPTDDLQMQIFQADLGADVDLLSFARGDDGLSGDLILNSGSSLFSGDGTPEAIFQLLRGIGTSIGLPTIDAVDRFTSVMGTMPVESVNADVYPGSPMSADLRVGSTENYSFSSGNVYRFPTSEGIADSVLGRPLQNTEINAEDITRSVSIDLRPGESSSVSGDGPIRTFHMGPGTPGYKAVGGSSNDGIRGNFRANVLIGNAGNDVINGGSGNDRLFGGPGDDYYIFNTASGLDFVDEEDGGGIDVLRIEGMHDYDSIPDDFTFRRFGNDLLIRLELNGQRNNNGDQIRISNMGTEASRVEALALLNTDGFVNRISLQSVWEQSTEARQRFNIVTGNDGFGTLVSPV